MRRTLHIQGNERTLAVRSSSFRRNRLIVAIALTLIIVALVLTIQTVKNNQPPRDEIAAARQCLTEARDAKAHIYAKSQFAGAEDAYQAAMESWKAENERFILKRDYNRMRGEALQTCILAQQAKINATASSGMLTSTLKIQIDSLQQEVNDFQSTFNKLPLSRPVREENSKGRLYLTEAELAYGQGQYLQCAEKLNSSSQLLAKSYVAARGLLKNYFLSYRQWQEWAEVTIRDTKQGRSAAVIVDKFARTCQVYKGGKLIRTFEVELGKNWIGDKNHQGDKATPEGFYKITKRMENRNTIYYKALLLDYPNQEDRRRFEQKKKSGHLPDRMQIGGNIEIHGSGGKGADWTDGCIALKDADMDELFKYCSAGTRVTIVGSLRPLNQIVI